MKIHHLGCGGVARLVVSGVDAGRVVVVVVDRPCEVEGGRPRQKLGVHPQSATGCPPPREGG